MATILAMVVLMAVPVAAQPELPGPGITPDSPFYFLDRLSDVFQSAESVADEKASEMVAMAQTADAKGLEKAKERYAKAMEKRQQKAEGDENAAEEVARQSSNHLAVLARVREQVPEQAKAGIDRAMNESMKGRERAIKSLEQKNRQRATMVAQATLQEVIANTPEAAQEGLQRALESVQRKVRQQAGAPPEEDRQQAGAPTEETAKEEQKVRQQAGAPTEDETDASDEGVEQEESTREEVPVTDQPSTPGGRS